MSFSSELKLELCRKNEQSVHCRIAYLAGIVSVSGRFEDSEDSDIILSIRVENEEVEDRTKNLLYQVADIPTSRLILSDESKHHRKLVLLDNNDKIRLCDICKFSEVHFPYVRVNDIVTERNCCKKAYLRGAFIAGGSMMSPEKGYQLEISAVTEDEAKKLVRILSGLHISAKYIKRKNRYVVYIKDGDSISELLGVIGGANSLMEFENVRIIKDIRNTVNREVNCDTANIAKTANAASKQLDDINYIDSHGGLGQLSSSLKTIAEIRIDNPYLSLKELGEKLDPPLGKSGVSHRLKKISDYADSLRDGYNK